MIVLCKYVEGGLPISVGRRRVTPSVEKKLDNFMMAHIDCEMQRRPSHHVSRQQARSLIKEKSHYAGVTLAI
jgi:hypothetical protein